MHKEITCLSISPNELTCAWITKHERAHPPHVLKAYQRTRLIRGEIVNGTIANPTELKKHITQFLATHNLHNSCIALSLDGPGIYESFEVMGSTTPQAHAFDKPALRNLVWDYVYLYPRKDGRFTFYVTGISRELLFQYQLLAIALQMNLVSLTTHQMAQLRAYRHTQGTSFSQARMGQDMARYRNSIATCLADANLTPHIALRSCTRTDLPRIKQLFGLYIVGKECYENG